MKSLTVFTHCDTLPEIDHPRPDRLVCNNPKRCTYNHYEVNGVSSGLWECEPGTWRIAFADGKDEFFHIISGKIRITDALGIAHEFGPGEAAVIPGGFRGLFEVLEHVRKHYVIVDRTAIPPIQNL